MRKYFRKLKNDFQINRNLKAAQKYLLSEESAPILRLGEDIEFQSHDWQEPNRAETPPLHIGDSGDRFSTLTGVWWLNEKQFVVNHRSGLRLALFDLSQEVPMIASAEIPHLTDDISARPLSDDTYEIAVSGCWACIYSLFHMRLRENEAPSFELVKTVKSPTKDFCHGVGYDDEGVLCTASHTGKDPRLYVGAEVYRLPVPWGARDICYDADKNRYLAVSVNKNPNAKSSYTGVYTGIWSLGSQDKDWTLEAVLENVHTDALDVHSGEVWLPDQLGNRVVAVDIDNQRVTRIISGDGLDFPHGLSISKGGKIAISNYGSSDITIFSAQTTDL